MKRYWTNSFPMNLAACMLAAILVAAGPTPAAAQWPAAQQPAPQTAEPVQRLAPQQLNDLVAPIALYPDPMLSQVLVASTYPLELMEAEQWLKGNPSLQGSQLMAAAKQQPWDPSVQAMVAFPQVLDRLTQDIRWTTDLGNAFLSQQSDVMAAVQHMRQLAEANGKLNSNTQQTVSTATQDGQSAIQVMPANPDVMYVPYYDPAYIWGPPVWGAYPALWYPPYGFGFWPGFNVGLFFGGWGWGGWGWGGWGWGPGWFNRTVIVNNNFFNHYGFHGGFGNGRGFWAHNPNHRLGVPYSNRALNTRYGAASMASRQNALRANAGSYGARNGMGAPNGMRNGFGGANGMRNGFAPGNGANRGAFNGARPNAGTPGGQGFRGGAQSFGHQGVTPSAPRNTAPAFRSTPNFGGGNRGFGGGGFHGFGGGGGGFHGGFGGGGFHGGGGGFHGGGGRR